MIAVHGTKHSVIIKSQKELDGIYYKCFIYKQVTVRQLLEYMYLSKISETWNTFSGFSRFQHKQNEPRHDKPTKWVCAQRRLRSAWASAQSDQSLRCPHEETLGPSRPTERTAKTLIRLGGCTG